jgi:hypothetical protein
VAHKKIQIEQRATLAMVKKEMARPRIVKSAREALLPKLKTKPAIPT